MSTDGPLLLEERNHILIATINRPDVHNALNAAVVAELRDAVVAAAVNTNTRAVVVTGAGEKAFSAGADLRELASMTADEAHETMRTGQQAFRQIEQAEIPVIAAVNGIALGGGFELALATTFPVLSTRASLGLPESSLGLIPGYGGTQRLPRAIGNRAALHVMLTGERLSAARAHTLGLTPIEPVEADELLPTALTIAEKISRQGPKAVRSILHAVDRGTDSTLDAGAALETGLAALAVASDESAEGISAFLEKRSAQFEAGETNDA